MSMPSNFKVKVVGLSFVPSYPKNVYALNEAAEARRVDVPVWFEGEGRDMEPIPVVLIRNPANEHDANAIEVHIPTLGDYAMVGHIPAPVAKRLAPCLDAGEIWGANVYMVAIHPDHPENPGIHLSISKIGSDEPF